MKQPVSEKIQQRRLQILIHSYLYYELNETIVSDDKWNQWAHELVELQKKYPNKSKKIRYHKQFRDFDGSTGAFFEYDSKTINRALYLLKMDEPPKKKTVGTKKTVKKKVKRTIKQRRLF